MWSLLSRGNGVSQLLNKSCLRGQMTQLDNGAFNSSASTISDRAPLPAHTVLHPSLEITATAEFNSASYGSEEGCAGQGRREASQRRSSCWLSLLCQLQPTTAAITPFTPPPSLIATHPAPYLFTTAAQSPPFSNPTQPYSPPLHSLWTSTATNPISNLKPLWLCSSAKIS